MRPTPRRYQGGVLTPKRPSPKRLPTKAGTHQGGIHQGGISPRRYQGGSFLHQSGPHQSGSHQGGISPKRPTKAHPPRRQFLHQSGTHQGGTYQAALHPTTQPTPQRHSYLSGISSHRHRTRRTRIKTPLTNPVTNHLTPRLINAGISLTHYIKHISLSLYLCHRQIPSHPIPSHLSSTIPNTHQI